MEFYITRLIDMYIRLSIFNCLLDCMPRNKMKINVILKTYDNWLIIKKKQRKLSLKGTRSNFRYLIPIRADLYLFAIIINVIMRVLHALRLII